MIGCGVIESEESMKPGVRVDPGNAEVSKRRLIIAGLLIFGCTVATDSNVFERCEGVAFVHYPQRGLLSINVNPNTVFGKTRPRPKPYADNDDSGKPVLRFMQDASELVSRLQVRNSLISLSDEKHYVVAMALLES